MVSGNSIEHAVIGLLILIVLFLAVREIVCWYWKINRIVELLESIDTRLRDRNPP